MAVVRWDPTDIAVWISCSKACCAGSCCAAVLQDHNGFITPSNVGTAGPAMHRLLVCSKDQSSDPWSFVFAICHNL